MGISRFIIFEVWEVLPLSLHRLHHQITSLDYIIRLHHPPIKKLPKGQFTAPVETVQLAAEKIEEATPVEPAPGTSSGRPAEGDTEADILRQGFVGSSVRAMLVDPPKRNSSSSEETDDKDKPGRIIIDRNDLAQLVSDLLDNQLHVTTKGGNIELRWSADRKRSKDNKKSKKSCKSETWKYKPKEAKNKPTDVEFMKSLEETHQTRSRPRNRPPRSRAWTSSGPSRRRSDPNQR